MWQTSELTLLASVDEHHAVLEEFPRDVEEFLHLIGHDGGSGMEMRQT